MKVTDNYTISFKPPKVDKLKTFLIDKHDFSQVRIENALKALEKEKDKQEQKSLSGF